MKTGKLLLGLMVALLTAGFLSCTKTNNVLVPRLTLTLPATKDASIFIEDVASSPQYGDNGDGASDLLRLGYSDNYSYFIRTLVAFDVSSIPKTAKIDQVILSFTMGKSGINASGDTISVHKVTQAWSEGTTDETCEYANQNYCTYPGATITSGGGVTWNSASHGTTAWTTAGGTFTSTASATNNNGIVSSFTSAGLIEDVKAWMDTPSSNNGWILKVNETYLNKNGGEQIRYYSREASTTKAGRTHNPTTGAQPSTKPTLTIIYH
jgi:hypothetical protein